MDVVVYLLWEIIGHGKYLQGVYAYEQDAETDRDSGDGGNRRFIERWSVSERAAY